MSVIQTDEWLLDSYDNPVEICKKLKMYFDGVSAIEIYDHLVLHGMYCEPLHNGLRLVKKLQVKNIWQIVKKEEKELQGLWGTPDIPIFIFPSESNDERIKNELNGMSGLTFKDKLFLFISENNVENDIKALFTHEYNHVFRLSTYDKNEKDYKLLDTIIMEGLAENAVRERLGDQFVAPWVSYYSGEELERVWKDIILPNRNISINQNRHQHILYGLRIYPKMAGYCVGYYLVKKYMGENGLACKDLINEPSKKIAQI